MKILDSFKQNFQLILHDDDPFQAFRKFLSICLWSITRDESCGIYAEEYRQMILPYKEKGTVNHILCMIEEVNRYAKENKQSEHGNDLLGEFFRQEMFSGRCEGLIMPFPLALKTARMLRVKDQKEHRMTVIDPSCGSGRVLLAFAQEAREQHFYIGMAPFPVLTKMCAINLFLNGLQGEVICSDFPAGRDFRFCYHVHKTGISVITQQGRFILHSLRQF